MNWVGALLAMLSVAVGVRTASNEMFDIGAAIPCPEITSVEALTFSSIV